MLDDDAAKIGLFLGTLATFFMLLAILAFILYGARSSIKQKRAEPRCEVIPKNINHHCDHCPCCRDNH